MDLAEEALRHLKLVILDKKNVSKSSTDDKLRVREEDATAPVFSYMSHATLNAQSQNDSPNGKKQHTYPQYGVLGHRIQDPPIEPTLNDLVYTNVAAPWSTFICGSQGSGKSHTLSCILENTLISNSPAGKLTSPLASLVLHYDKFTSFSSTQLCEAAYLASARIPVRVLVSPTNYLTMKRAYTNLAGLKGSTNLTVERMYLPQKDLNVSMMKTLMGIQSRVEQPLYIQTVMKILRDMAIDNQGGDYFNYGRFKHLLSLEEFMRGQAHPLRMRMDVLESFFKPEPKPGFASTKTNGTSGKEDDIWKFEKGTLTIVDLSCPFVDADDACALFNICISLFLKDRHKSGRIIAMDEAHKFLTSTSIEAMDLTDTLLSIVRQQRHLGTRVVVATQEPTISPTFLDLCNLTIIHRFSSPAWFKAIKAHIAGAVGDKATKAEFEADIFRRIVDLGTGQALLFCPTALLDVEPCEETTSTDETSEEDDEDDEDDSASSSSASSFDGIHIPNGNHRVVQLGSGHAHIQVRPRVTVDGGRSLIEK